jgi:CIC family chloride channel protein
LGLGEEQRGLILQSIFVGLVAWAAVFVLKELVHWLFHTVLHWIEHAPTAAVLFLPLFLGAALVAILAGVQPISIDYKDKDKISSLDAVEGDGLERAIALYHSSNPLGKEGGVGAEGLQARWHLPTSSLAALKFAATLATLGSGGSGGLEASAALIGESLGAAYYRLRAQPSRREGLRYSLFRPWAVPNSEHLQVAQLSGIAAAVTALIGAPVAAAFFATEVMYRNRPLLEKFFYSLISAVVARMLSTLVMGARPTLFEIPAMGEPPGDWRYLAFLVLTAVAIAAVGQAFRLFRLVSVAWFERRLNNRWVRLLLGAAITGLIAYSVAVLTVPFVPMDTGLKLVLGSGESAINMAFAGQLTLTLALVGLVAKMPATLATISSGGSGGLLVPSLFFGTMVATILAKLGGLPEKALIAPALTASLVALVNTPLAALLLAIELFGSSYVVPGVLALLIAYMLSNPRTIYRTQKQHQEADSQIAPRKAEQIGELGK